MVKFLICICSNNVNKLKVTISSLLEMKLLNNFKVSILIIDNSNNIKIQDYIKIISKKKFYKIYYFFEKKNGIPKIRNRCLKEAREIDANYICFFDDDSFVEKNWLIKNLKIFNKFKKCSIISGPQHSSKKHIFYEVLKPKFKHLSKITWCSTNNVIFKKKLISDKKINFDERLSNIGGSDQLFFKKLFLKGFEIRWNQNTAVIEKYQKKRESISWFLKRNFRYASSSVLIDRYSLGFIKGLILSILKINYYLFLFLLNFLLILFSPKKNILESLKNLVRVFSILVGLFGFFPKKYI